MINIPKTLCANTEPVDTVRIVQLSPIETCEANRCEGPEPTELVPILKTLCPCPVEKVVVNYSPKPRKTRVIKTCFEDFIKNVTSTKFCDKRPVM